MHSTKKYLQKRGIFQNRVFFAVCLKILKNFHIRERISHLSIHITWRAA